MPPTLSYETERRVKALFSEKSRAEAIGLLVDHCGNNLHFCEDDDRVGLERIRFAALKLSGGDLVRLKQAIELAKLDWRDLLAASDFADNPYAHTRWFPHGFDRSRR
jgi:hypothetical protein